ncbi:hypothetical protein D3C73_856920 [compost metagenome]
MHDKLGSVIGIVQHPQWQPHPAGHTLRPEQVQAHLGRIAVQLAQAQPRIGQADTMATWRPGLLQRAVLVAHLDAQHVTVAAALDLDGVLAKVAADAMAQRVFHQRLQDQAWNRAIKQFWCDVDAAVQAVLETRALDAQVQLDQFQFLAQTDFLAIVVLQKGTQQLAQAQQHVFGTGLVFIQQGDDCVQRIEQEMRLQLRLQCQQPRLRQLGRHPACLDLAAHLFLLEMQRLLDREQGPVGQQAHREMLGNEIPQLLAKAAGLEPCGHQGTHHHRQPGHPHTGQQLHTQTGQPSLGPQRIAFAQGEHQRRQRRPSEPLDHRPAQVDLERE